MRNRSIVGVLVLLLTACAGSDTATTAAVSDTATEPPPITATDSIEPATTSSTSPTSKGPGDDPSDDDQDKTSDDPSAVRGVEESHDWVLTEVDGATVTLLVAVGSGTCDRFDRVDVTETGEEVSVVAVVVSGGGPSSRRVCTMDMGFSLVEVTLEQPLGTREVTGCLLNREGSYFDDDRGIDRTSCADIVADFFG